MNKRILSALMSGILCAVPVATTYAQTRQPRVQITSLYRSEPLRPPAPPSSNRTTALAMPATDVQRWMDRTDAPPLLKPGPLGTHALAGDLRIQNVQYSFEARVLILVAEKLRIGPNAMIDLSGWRTDGSAGKVIILSNEIICEPGGSLHIVAKGLGVSTNGGQVLVSGASQPATPEGTLPPCIAATVDGAPEKKGIIREHRRTAASSTAGTAVIRDHRRNAGSSSVPPTATATPTETIKIFPAGRPGVIFASTDIRAVMQKDEQARAAWSMWAVERLETLRIAIYDASRRSDRQGIASLFRDYEKFNPTAQMISADMRDRYLAVVADLQNYRANAMPPLWVEELSVRPSGLPQPISVFTEGATLKTSLAPTHALATRTSIDGRSVLGIIDYRSDRPDELAIEAEWELSVDPWIERLAAEQLDKRSQTLDGIFNGWSLEAKPLQEMAIKSASATLLPGGRRLRMRIVADAARANLVFWRLLNSTGLPWSVDWKFVEPGSGRVVNGTWAGPPLTLMRQRNQQVTIEDGHLVNKSSNPVVVNYLRNNDGSFFALNPVIRLEAGERVKVPTTAASAIPPEAVENLLDPDKINRDFYVINGEQIVDRIVVRNLIPTSDAERGAFDRLEITVRTGVEGDAVGVVSTEPFVLSATGTRAGEISIPMLRLARGKREVTIEGRAYYSGGSYRTLKPTTFDSLTIAITSEMFQ